MAGSLSRAVLPRRPRFAIVRRDPVSIGPACGDGGSHGGLDLEDELGEEHMGELGLGRRAGGPS